MCPGKGRRHALTRPLHLWDLHVSLGKYNELKTNKHTGICVVNSGKEISQELVGKWNPSGAES